MARIKGRFDLSTGKSLVTISYHDPRLLYQDWRTYAYGQNGQGHFEIFAPVGDVTLNFRSGDKAGELLLKDLKAHETREVELSFDPKP